MQIYLNKSSKYDIVRNVTFSRSIIIILKLTRHSCRIYKRAQMTRQSVACLYSENREQEKKKVLYCVAEKGLVRSVQIEFFFAKSKDSAQLAQASIIHLLLMARKMAW